MKFALPLFVTAAVFASGIAHAATGKLSTPPGKQCVSETMYGTVGRDYYGQRSIPIYHRGPDTGCHWTLLGFRHSLPKLDVAAKRR